MYLPLLAKKYHITTLAQLRRVILSGHLNHRLLRKHASESVFAEVICDNVNPCIIDKSCISLDNKTEAKFVCFCYLCVDNQSIGSKKVFDKTTAAQVHGANFVVFDFLEDDNYSESL